MSRRRRLAGMATGPALAGLLVIILAASRMTFDRPWLWITAGLILLPTVVLQMRDALRTNNPGRGLTDLAVLCSGTVITVVAGWTVAFIVAYSAALIYGLYVTPGLAEHLAAIAVLGSTTAAVVDLAHLTPRTRRREQSLMRRP